MRIIIFGGTGFIGTHFIRAPELREHELIVVTRNTDRTPPAPHVTFVGYENSVLKPLFSGNYAIVNLAGAGIADRFWTPSWKNKILESRVKVTERISELVNHATDPPVAVLQGSAVGYYGSRGEEPLTENAAKGTGFLPEVVDHWEKALEIRDKDRVRCIFLRTGLVLGEKGLLSRLVPVFKWYLGGNIGRGKQWMPWIHIEDQVGAMVFLLFHKKAEGHFNLCVPTPARMKEVTKALGRTLNRPVWVPVPPFIFRLIPYGFGKEILLTSQQVLPKKLIELEYNYKFTNLDKAFSNLLNHA